MGEIGEAVTYGLKHRAAAHDSSSETASAQAVKRDEAQNGGSVGGNAASGATSDALRRKVYRG